MNIYLNNETDFIHNGLGFLRDVLNASISDNLNGDYSLYFEYKIDGQLSEYLKNENIVKCKVADGTKQLFIIKNVNKTFDSIQVSCKHIFYLLLDNFIEDTAPTNLSCQPFLKWVLDKTNFSTQFQVFSDITTPKSARYVRKNPVEIILGDESNSVVNLFGGELKRDNFSIYINKQIGSDNGVKLIVGKNITGINITIDTSTVYTRIMPQGFDGLFLPEKYIDSPLINNYINPKIYKAEFSDIKYDLEDESAYHDIEEAYSALRNATNELFESGIDKPIINVKVDWIELSKTNEYKNYSNLEKVMLGDTITIDLLGLTYQTKVIKTIYNPLTDRIESFEIGTPKANIGTSTNSIQKQVESINPNSILESAKDNATQLITKAMGGYVYKTQNELFIMDTDNPNTATTIWRWNMNGLGYSKNGIDGPYETAITSDGQIVADFITTGKLNTNLIEGFDELIINVTNSLNDIYTKEEINQLIQTAESGLTNNFIQSGGNNIFRNTGLWFENSYEEAQENPYEFWQGKVERKRNDESSSKNSMLLQEGTLIQEQEVVNGIYTVSFVYKKLIELANISVFINDVEYELTQLEKTEFCTGQKNSDEDYIVYPLEVSSNHITIKFVSDTDNALEVWDLMVNKGSEKVVWTQNENETTTDTVNISKGILITSSDLDVQFKANADGIRTLDKNGNELTKFTDKGMTTKEAIIEKEANIVGILRQRVGDQVWDSFIG